MTNYTGEFYAKQSAPSRQSAEIVLPCLLDLIGQPRNVIDLGCGLGSWLAFFHTRGIDVCGVDGDYVTRSSLMIPERCFVPLDLAAGDYSGIQGRYDLALSLEVAEHLPEAVAETFVGKLCALSDTVLFSAAIPLQGGVNHINCQWQQGYWHRLFLKHGFVGTDSLRKRIWFLDGIKHHYKQNMLLYVKEGTELHLKLRNDTDFIPDVVHPYAYLGSKRDAAYHKGKRLKIAGVAMLDHGNEIFRSVDSAGEWLRLKNFDTMILGGSDHEPFALRGIPAMYISTGLKSPYHKPEDTADKIDYEGMTLITGYMTDLTASMASRDELEASGRRSFKHKDEPRLEFGLTASVGDNSHSYKRGALEGKSAIAWNAGVWAHINFGNWTLRPKVLYEQRNALMPVDFEQRTSTTLRTGGVYVPLDVMYKLRFGGMRGVYLYAFGGGYYSRFFDARIGGDRVDFSANGAMRRNEWGWQGGAGINIYKFWLEGTYRRGLTDVFPEGGITNSTGYMSLGYKF